MGQVTSYQYDYENKLKRIDYPDGTYSEYRYDPFGNRIKKDVNGTAIWFVYDLMKMLPDLIGEYDDGGALIAGYTHGPGIDDVISMKRGGDSYYYFKDALGSIRSLSDSSETTVNNYEYDAFGSVFSKTELVVNPYGFTGRVLDNESGLMYYRMRYYDPGIGRFITADPIRFQGGINFYTYCLNNPVNFIDQYGLCPEINHKIPITYTDQSDNKNNSGWIEIKCDLLKSEGDCKCPGDTKECTYRCKRRYILVKNSGGNVVHSWEDLGVRKYTVNCGN